MKFWTVALVGLTMMASAERVFAQGGSIGAPSSRPATGSVGSSSPAPSQARPSRPWPSSTRPPSRGATGVVPVRVAGPRASRGVRPLWFGLVAFDRSWLWTPTVVDMTVDAPPLAAMQGLVGGLQLDIEPRRALVYVDGWYVGLVEEFSGYYRHLDVSPGLHTVEIVATDCEPLVFEMAISPGRTTTYRGSLQRASGRH